MPRWLPDVVWLGRAPGVALLAASVLAASVLAASPAGAQLGPSGAPPLVGPGGGLAGFGGPADQEQRGRAQDRARELQRIAPPLGDVEIRRPPPAAVAPGRCVPIHRVEIAGASHLSLSRQQALAAPYAGHCVSLAQLDHLLDALNAAYLDSGYVTARAYLPPQDLSGGRLQVVVVEGTIAGFTFKGEPADHHALAAFGDVVGTALNLRTLEQGLEQMNRLPSWDARLHIEPGPTPGTSVVVIEAPDTGWLHGATWLDTYGEQVSGRDTGHVLVRADDPFGWLDAWSGEYDHSLLPLHPQRSASYAAADVSAPYGSWTGFFDWRYADYAYPLTAAGSVVADTVRLSGETLTYKPGVSRVVARDQLSKTTVELAYELKQVQSFLNTVRLVTGSESLASLSVRLSHSRRMLGGAYYATLGLQAGLPGLGTANVLPHPASVDPHADYVRPSLDLDIYQPVPLASQLHSSLHAEYASAHQYAPQALQIGGIYTVRGFLDTSLIGDLGFYTRNDLLHPLPRTGIAALDALSGLVEAYLGLDAGWVAADAWAAGTARSLVRGGIAGAAFGIRSESGPLFWDISANRALALASLRDPGWIGAVQAGVKF